jgi:GNAT superfamily N-acetyltransferase
VPEQLIRIRNREAADIDLCVQALATVHSTSGYPTNWAADPARWLAPPGIARAWIATTNELPIAGHVILRQLPASAAGERTAEVSRLFVVPAARRQGIALAMLQETIHWAATNELDLVLEVAGHLRAARALYERAGFRLVNTKRADWTTPDGQPVTLHRYARSCQAGNAESQHRRAICGPLTLVISGTGVLAISERLITRAAG